MSDTDHPRAHTKKEWFENNLDVSPRMASALEDAFPFQNHFFETLESGDDLTEYDGIGENTANAVWDWYRNDYGGEVEVDGTLVLDDDGLHLPDWLVGYVGRFTVETPTITMRPTVVDPGLREVSNVLAAYPDGGTWNLRLSEGQVALSTPGQSEKIYDIDDQRSGEDGGSE